MNEYIYVTMYTKIDAKRKFIQCS